MVFSNLDRATAIPSLPVASGSPVYLEVFGGDNPTFEGRQQSEHVHRCSLLFATRLRAASFVLGSFSKA